MTELLILEHKKQLVADSRDVAVMIGKSHDQLMRSIRTYETHLDSAKMQSRDFFIKYHYLNSQNKKQPLYYLTKKGCDMVANKMTGRKGTLFTAAYINRFYEMEQALKSREMARRDFPQFTEAIKNIHEKPAPYHFSNECDLINRLVLNMTAKQYREVHNIPRGESIRPYLSADEIYLIDYLQHADIGLLIAERDYGKRKMLLEWYKNSIANKRITA